MMDNNNNNNDFVKVEDIKELLKEDKEKIFCDIAGICTNSLISLANIFNSNYHFSIFKNYMANNEIMDTSTFYRLNTEYILSHIFVGGSVATGLLALYFAYDTIKNVKQLQEDKSKAEQLEIEQYSNHR